MSKALTPPAFYTDALCRQIGGDLFYPEKGQHSVALAAKRVCNRCPVTTQCLDHALANDEQHGIWGGVTERGRRRMRSQRRQAA